MTVDDEEERPSPNKFDPPAVWTRPTLIPPTLAGIRYPEPVLVELDAAAWDDETIESDGLAATVDAA